ncbi:MAG: amidohydrolase [Gammaproteobacteria bacterium]|nr:amidohydrolase [Gammaproteobacteria bacterium]
MNNLPGQVRIFLVASLILVLVACGEVDPSSASVEPGDYVFKGSVYTSDEVTPWASAVVVKNDRIIFVDYAEGSRDVSDFIGDETVVVELGDRLLVPGFIDGHTHFNRAGQQINDANLLKVANDPELRSELQRVIKIVGEGEWITGGSWGAYETWQDGSSGGHSDDLRARWQPTRSGIDDISAGNPVFINSFEESPELYLANTLALKNAGLLENPLPGMDTDEQGTATGLIRNGSPAIAKIQAVVEEKSHSRILNEARAALKSMREHGVVEIHDITPTDYEQVYLDLQNSGELTARIWMRADLARAAEFNDKGIKMNTHPVSGERDTFLRWGAHKGYIDGIMGNHSALFFEAYDDRHDHYGSYRHHTSDDPEHLVPNMEKMYGYLKEAHKGGFKANVHAIGTRGVSLMLDTYERLQRDLGGSLEGFRVIHCQVVRPQDFDRFNKLGVIAEVNPYHLSDDMRWMEERIGHERSKGAYAFRSLLESGATLVFASDWPGTNAAEYYNHPKYLLHAAVNRTTTKGTPNGGWFPEEKISLEDAVKAYTINGARATFDGDVKGSIRRGKLADLVILDRNIFERPPEELLDMQVDLTMVNGSIVFERSAP